MKHLISHSVYQKLEDLHPDLPEKLREIRCDGLELLTSHLPVDPVYKDLTETVHLPFATDWYKVWNGGSYDLPENFSKFYTYGTDRDSIISTIRNMIEYASVVEPAHGVIHAGDVDLRELRIRNYTGDCRKILECFAEMMNSAVSGFKGGEPPFKLVFENLWWPGLRMKDDSDYRILEKNLEFENWGICLDTGHLMNSLPDIDSEQDGIEAVQKIIDSYSKDALDAISAMHFHYSASWQYRKSFIEEPYTDGPIGDYIRGSYKHINTLDQHLPFSDPACKGIVDRIEPEFIIHELPGHGHDPLIDYVQQRNLLD